MKPLLLLLLLLAPACVTAQDIRDVADSVGRLEAVAADTSKTTSEVQAQVAATKADIEVVAERVEDETEGFFDTLASAEGGVAGALSLAAMVALNAYRTKTRKQALRTKRG